MYCVKCGVKLGDAEKRCPLCDTEVYHPQILRQETQPLYPLQRYPKKYPRSLALPIIMSTVFLLPMLITALCDWQINGTITWSGFVVGALVLSYVMMVLPAWFEKPVAAVLLLCDFAAVDGYLLYINHVTGGSWFWGFAFPLVSALGILAAAVVILLRRFPRGGFYIIGGALMALGAYMPVMEHLIDKTFRRPLYVVWSLYPMVTLVLLGLMLIFLGANRTARQVLERKFFV